MKTLTLCPFPVLPLIWEAAAGRAVLTVLVKATFAIEPGRALVPAPAQEPLGGDRLLDGTPGGGLFAISDWVPAKPRRDVVLVGHVYAPHGAPVESLTARLVVGSVAKSITVSGDRVWARGAGGLVPSRAAMFTSMPLRDDRAPRSPASPGGFVASTPHEGALAAPNLHPSSFAPIAPSAPARRALVDDGGFAWAYRLSGPAPEGFAFAFYNAAPWDQRADELPPGAPVRLENLHPTHPIVETRLPEAPPRAFVVTREGALREISLACDTVWIDADRAVMVLSYRGSAEVTHEEVESATLAVGAPSPEAPDVAQMIAAALGIELATESEDDPATLRPPPDESAGTVEFSAEAIAAARRAAQLPFREAAESDAITPPSAPGAPANVGYAGQTIDFGARPARAPATPFEPSARGDHTIDVGVLAPAPATPFRVDAEPGHLPAPAGPAAQSGLTVDLGTAGMPSDLAAFAATLRAQRAQKAASAVAPPAPPPMMMPLAEPPPMMPLPEPPPVMMPLAEPPSMVPLPEPPSMMAPPASPPISAPLAPPPMMAPLAPPMMSGPPDPPPAPPPASPPHAPPAEPLALETFAEISADLSRKRPLAEALASRRIDAATWAATEKHWKGAINDPAQRSAFDVAFVAALEKARAEGPFTVADYARIMVGVERGKLPALAASYGVPPPDVMRVQRVWLKRIAADAALSAEAQAAIAAERAR